VVINVVLSVAGMCCGQKRQIQHPGMCCGHKRRTQRGWNVLWSKTSDSASLECAVVINVVLSVAGMCCGQKRQIQHRWNVLWS
jgi:hypothetical protein